MLDLVLGSDFILNLSLFTKLLFCCSTLFWASSRLMSITFLNVSAFIYKLLISPKTFWVHLSPCFCIMASKLTNSCSSYESFLFDLISSFLFKSARNWLKWSYISFKSWLISSFCLFSEPTSPMICSRILLTCWGTLAFMFSSIKFSALKSTNLIFSKIKCIHFYASSSS